MNNFQEKVTFIWDIADLLRGPYKKNEYQKVILPFTVLKRFDSVLKDSKKEVLHTYNQYKDEIGNLEHILLSVAKDSEGRPLGFYNYSRYDFDSLLEDPENIEENIIHYIESFSKNVQDIFDNFKIKENIENLDKANLLFLVVKKFSNSKINLHPNIVNNHEMGTIFEELIRRFSEQSNEEAGEHFTPRDVVKLMTLLMFAENGITLKKKGIIKTIYDPACGTGGMLTSCKDYLTDINPDLDIVLFGQEIQPEIYAICKSDMLMKGEHDENIKGPTSTLSDDQLAENKFDYIISNPPYGTKWEADQKKVKDEAKLGYKGRFGAGLPRINDGQLLFLQHMISKMKSKEKSRIAVITNGSPLFTGDAGSGESEIRKWMFEQDFIEAIIALPEQLFYNTSIKTYIWVMTNEKPLERVGKIQLIDATSEYNKMKRSLGNKRRILSDENINSILDHYSEFGDIQSKNVKIFDNEEFGYTKVIVERPMQLNYQVTEDRLENLYSINAFAQLSESKSERPDVKLQEEESGKAKQEEIINSLKTIGNHKFTNWNMFEKAVKSAISKFDLSHTLINNIILALSEHDETAEYVTDRKGKKKPDTSLRDSEKIPLGQNVKEYFEKEVKPYYLDAWMDRKKDKVGYEINFTKYFYEYIPPRPLEEIESDIKRVTAEIQELIKEDLE